MQWVVSDIQNSIGRNAVSKIYYLGTPRTDPEVSSSCIDLAQKLVPHYLHTFLDVQIRPTLSTLFTFTLNCLAASEIMPKRSAAGFWVGPTNPLI